MKRVINGEINSYSFGGDDWCILTVQKDKTTIVNGFDEFEPVEISTDQILNLMIGWLGFLKSTR